MRRIPITAAIALTLLASALAQKPSQSSVYYPAAGDNWQRKPPAEAGFNPELLEQAVAFAKTQETRQPRDFSTQVQNFGALLGPIPKDRAETNGIIIRHGYIVAEWGETSKVDMTFSVTKTFVSTVVGLALDRGLIGSLNDRAKDAVGPEFQVNSFTPNPQLRPAVASDGSGVEWLA